MTGVRFLVTGCMICWAVVSMAQHHISGAVYSNGLPVPFANVVLTDINQGTVADVDGKFSLMDVPKGPHTLQISSVGMKRFVSELDVQQSIQMGEVNLDPDVLGLEEVVVTGTMKQTFLSASPVKIEVVTGSMLQKLSSPTNLIQAVKLINGVQEVVGCGVCYTNNISVNGLPGQYTAILVDGSPIFGNLASVYGLNGIPRQVIERIEIIKGPNSTLYGSEAMAGVINIITKDPKNQPTLAADFRMTSHLEMFGNLAWSPKIKKWNATIGANFGFMDHFQDDNNDAFGDIVGMDRLSAFTKWTRERKDNRRLSIMGKFYYEDRRNGVEAYTRDRAYQTIRGNDSIYGESIYTYRGELFGTYDLPMKEKVWIDYSFSYHDQDSYYGSDSYKAKQYIAFSNFLWNRKLGGHDLTAGLTARYQFYDDNTVATETAERQVIPGILVQDEWNIVNEKVDLLTGVRLDYYDAHGPVVSPRVNLKYKPGKWSTLRMNFGTGFKVVNLFTEDHAFVTGQREVVLEEKLAPERSYNGAIGFNHVYTIGNSQGTIDVDGFYTHFTNKIIPDYETAGQIVYGNTNGFARSWGASAAVNHSFKFPLNVRVGFNYVRATQTEEDENGDLQTDFIQFAPRWTGNAAITYTWRKAHLEFAYSANVTGPMTLPVIYDLGYLGNPIPEARPTVSKPFYIDNIQITYLIPKWGMRVFAGVENIFGYRQPISPLSGYDDPNSPTGFSPHFDTSYAYGPIHGREIYGGLSWDMR